VSLSKSLECLQCQQCLAVMSSGIPVQSSVCECVDKWDKIGIEKSGAVGHVGHGFLNRILIFYKNPPTAQKSMPHVPQCPTQVHSE
jgi:hypothetical protein